MKKKIHALHATVTVSECIYMRSKKKTTVDEAMPDRRI